VEGKNQVQKSKEHGLVVGRHVPRGRADGGDEGVGLALPPLGNAP